MRLVASGGFSCTVVGKGEPQVTVSVGVHGDEHAPVRGMRHFLRSHRNARWRSSVRFVVCNERALADRKRFIACDLNTSFPGDPFSPDFEARLAAEIDGLLPTRWHVDLHSTSFPMEPYGIVASRSVFDSEMLLGPVVNYVVVDRPSYISGRAGALAFEVGAENDPKSERTASEIIQMVLTSAGCLSGEPAGGVDEIRLHRISSVIKRSEMTSIASEVADFSLLPEGAELGRSLSGRPVLAQQAMVPIWVNHPEAIRVSPPPELVNVCPP